MGLVARFGSIYLDTFADPTGGGFLTIIVIAALFGWVNVCLLVRAQVKSFREKEFVRFLLSREGQQIIADNRLFIPLSAEQAKAELAKLD